VNKNTLKTNEVLVRLGSAADRGKFSSRLRLREGVKKARWRGGPRGRPLATIRQLTDCPYNDSLKRGSLTPLEVVALGTPTRV